MAGSVMLALLLAVPSGPGAAPQVLRPSMTHAAPVPISSATVANRLPAQKQAPGPADDPLVSDTMRSDARLADVCFVDVQHGWAVGDRGTIWHTNDGGQHWHLQRSGVACRLESVSFVDSQIGWAAGGLAHPYTHTSSGILLSTSDGGQHWRQHAKLLLPALKQVRFFDRRRGWAIGCSSAMFPSGVFLTDDGGRSWTPLSAEAISPWLAADFVDRQTGALAGRDGAVAAIQQGGVRPAQTGGFGLRNLTQIRLVAPVHGWLVGDGGLAMVTNDLGASWQTPPAALPEGTARQFDFAALAVRGSKCWIAGSPGTRVFHLADAGRGWEVSSTGTQLPIDAMTFVDDDHGWAVGALGTILATSDGGRSWSRQRAGGTRAALLGLFSQGRDVPLELFARLCGNEGYLGVVEVLNRRDVEVKPQGELHPADRTREALVAVGASDARTAWQFPLRQAGLRLGPQRIIEGWDRANDARGLEELELHVARQIRLWRPEVIFTHDADPRGNDPVGHLINQVVLEALRKAADPTCFTQQITQAGLEPWQVKRVYAALPPGSHGLIEVSPSQWAPRLGCSLAEVAAMPRGLLENRFSVAGDTLGFRLLVSRPPQETGQRDFFSHIVLYPGGEARRELVQPSAESLDLLRRTAQQRRNAEAILEQSEKQPQGGTPWLAQTDELTRGLDGGRAGWVLYHLAQRYIQSGRWWMAAQTLQLLTERYPEHPLSQPALLWLVQYYASGEAAWRSQGQQRYAVRQASALSINMAQQEDGPNQAAQLGKQIETTRPELFASPALRFPLAVAYRKQGLPRQAERYYLSQALSADRGAWWACAQGERWLAEPKGLPPKSVVRCVRAGAKPRLDGRLEDAVWRKSRPTALRSAQHDDAQWPAVAMLAYDDQFLYLAVQCRQASEATSPAGSGPRPRDADLSAHDRVDVLLDVDRDFVTYYRFSIDHRGWTAESCWGDATWNPTWFVAAETADGVWTAEAAVPLDQLAGRYPASREVWALGIQRTVPDVGFQSWTEPAATAVVPEGFGYLIFE